MAPPKAHMLRLSGLSSSGPLKGSQSVWNILLRDRDSGHHKEHCFASARGSNSHDGAL